ncbi:MAG: 16S rRNA (cytosine1402-N4)-methyltransferase [Parcubacteria group bacterium Gr01-1014_107]|nr:MAG: 16S rRNA (cytosine1402-N4)-methyltransferase [Parcubacteria group bacterium Gr01-1014_107]
MGHVPVLLQEVLDGLAFGKSDKIFLDATVGAAGHSLAICEQFPYLEILGLDADEEAVALAQENLLEKGCRFRLGVGNFRELEKTLRDWQVHEIDKALFDLGMSTMQLETSGRGFSFRKDEPLIMTFGRDWKNKLTAFEIINHWPKSEIERILREYGEESAAKRITEALVRQRKAGPIRTTSELVKVIEEVSGRRGRRHPATKSFQALRMIVNDELSALKDGLEGLWRRLKEGGRVAVISFHSLEDRIVKNFFRDLKKEGKVNLVTKKPIRPTREEISLNPRSRSAKLRVAEKIGKNNGKKTL